METTATASTVTTTRSLVDESLEDIEIVTSAQKVGNSSERSENDKESLINASEQSSAAVTNKLFVGNLHTSVTEGDLIKLFQHCGEVQEVQYVWHRGGPLRGQPKGFAFVYMSSPQEASVAIRRLHRFNLRGRPLIVAPKDSPEDSSAQQSAAPRYVRPLPQPQPSIPNARSHTVPLNNKSNNSSNSRTAATSGHSHHSHRGTAIPPFGGKRPSPAASVQDNIKRLKAMLGEDS